MNGISYSTVMSRMYKLGWERERALSQEPRITNRMIEFNGETHTITEWAQIIGINRDVIYYRLLNGWSTERALTEKVHNRKAHRCKGG